METEIKQEGIKVTENYYGAFFDSVESGKMKNLVEKTIQELKDKKYWNEKWDLVFSQMEDKIKSKASLDHVTFAHCNDVSNEGSERLEEIKKRANHLSQVVPNFKILGIAISENVVALHVTLTFPDWNPANPMAEEEKKMLGEIQRKQFPHITVSFVSGKASAVDSNYLLEELNPDPVNLENIVKSTKFGESVYIPYEDDVSVKGKIEEKEYSYFKKQ